MLLSILLLAAGARAEEVLSLQAYLAQVETGNASIRASRTAAEGLPLKALEPDMYSSPLFTANYGYLDDRKEPLSPLSPDRTKGYNWSLGVSKRFFTGTTASFNYGMNYSQLFLAPFTIPGLPPALAAGLNFLPAAPFYDARPSFTVSQSLLRDFMSGLTDSGTRAVHLRAAAGEKAERFRARAVLWQAEQAYWNLSLARSVVSSKHASLDRTAKLAAWTEGRVNLNLADEADLLQAQAALKLRELDLKLADQELVAAARAFNTARGRPGEEARESVGEINASLAAAPDAALKRESDRLDVVAAKLELDSAEAGARANWYKALPDLSAFGTVAWNGHDLTSSSASKDALTGDRPTYMIGAAFIAPLDLVTLRKIQRGYDADFSIARDQEAAARLAADQDWAGLLRRWEDVKTRLALAGEIEALQEKKLAKETERFNRGRSTTFQLLTFEEDFSQAQLNRLRFGLERLLLEAQARWFNAKD